VTNVVMANYAALHAAQARSRQHQTAIIVSAYQHRRRSAMTSVPGQAIRPKPSQTAPDVTQIGIEADQTYHIKLARLGNFTRQYELTDGAGQVLCDGIGDDRFEALFRMLSVVLFGPDAEAEED
jgi:hypothetical protein